MVWGFKDILSVTCRENQIRSQLGFRVSGRKIGVLCPESLNRKLQDRNPGVKRGREEVLELSDLCTVQRADEVCFS